MADKTGIQWTQATWNPIVGCSVLSPGCKRCYAMKMAARIQRMTPGSHYADTTRDTKAGPVWTGTLKLAPEHILLQPLRWSKPRTIFVNSMSDLFHESIPDAWIDQVFAIMALCPQHTFQVLTKRSARMREYLSDGLREDQIGHIVHEFASAGRDIRFATLNWTPRRGNDTFDFSGRWPLPNVWLGVSTEDQRRADERVPDLLATPAALRFVSAEPLLGPIEFGDLVRASLFSGSIAATGGDGTKPLGWIIVGGESGHGARPMHPDWARSIRVQCVSAGVPFFFKQWGTWRIVDLDREAEQTTWMIVGRDGYRDIPDDRGPDEDIGEVAMTALGKTRAGRLLDGVTHDALPGAIGAPVAA